VGKLLDSTVSETHTVDRTEGSVPIVNMYGENVRTTPIFIAFQMWFNNKFKAMAKERKTVCNLTDGGLRLEHTTEARFLDFIAEWGEDIQKYEFPVVEYKDNKTAIIKEIVQAYKLLSGVVKASYEILDLLREIEKELPGRDRDKINVLVNKVAVAKVATDHPFLQVIFAYHFKIELYLNRYEVREIDNIKDKFACLTAQVDKGLNYYGELIEACDLFVIELDKVLQTFGITEHKEN
jgi:hypothetical protein